MTERTGEANRQTRETKIYCRVNLDGNGLCEISTPIPFLTHMLEAFARHSAVDITLSAQGDVEVDMHHTNEDIGIVLGTALASALSDKVGILRFGYAYAPLDEALARSVIDVSGRPYCEMNVYAFGLSNIIDGYSIEYARQFFVALANQLKATIHIDVIKGKDFHHICEALFKSFALAFRMAKAKTGCSLPSTKGRIDG